MADFREQSTDAGVEPFGALMVNTGFATLFYDSWSVSPIDTTDKWTVTGTAPTISGGNMQMAAAASTYNAIRTKDVVRANVGFTLVRNGFMLEAATATGAGRFWGLGTPATTPAAAVLAQDGIGYELDQAAGTLLAVTYANGVRTTVATLTRPTDGLNHGYGLYFRVTQAYWMIDGMQVAALAFPNVPLVELPALIVRQNAAAFTGTPAFTNIAHLTADTARQGTLISDPVIGIRQARVKAGSAAALAADQSLVVALSPNSPTPPGANSIGTVQQAALTKGTQGGTGVTVQNLKDAGRVSVSFTAEFSPAAVAEAMLSIGASKDGAAAVAATSYVITNGKRLRITSISSFVENTLGTSIQRAYLRMRFAATGGALTTSPLQMSIPVSAAGTVKSIATVFEDIPDGLEFLGDGVRAIGLSLQAPDWVTGSATLKVYVTVIGFEY